MATIRLCTVRIIAFLLSLLADHTLYAHGFASTTLIRSDKEHGWSIIEQTAYLSKERKKQRVTSYDADTASWTTKRVTGGAYATTNCYCRLSFDEDPHHDIICSPSQLFYRYTDSAWVPAYELKVNDLLLAEQGTHVCLHNLVLVKEHLKLHTIQVEDTHTFLVGVYGIVAHNMLVPVSAIVGLSVPFGVEWGGAAGSFFGPPGVIGGIVIGGLLGCVIKSCTTNKVREYQLVFDPAKIQRHLLNNNSKSDQSSAPKHLRQSVLAQPMLDPEDPDKDKERNKKQVKREQVLQQVDTYEQARNKALEILKDVDPHTAEPHIGRIRSGRGKITGIDWHEGKVTLRLDWDPVKQAHINITDFRKGSGSSGVSIAIPFNGNLETVLSLYKHMNTPASINQAKALFELLGDCVSLDLLKL